MAQPEMLFSDTYDYKSINQKQLFFAPNDSLSPAQSYALSSAVIGVYLSATAFAYQSLLADTTQADLPFEEKIWTNYVISPVAGDTLYRVDLRLFSPEPVGRRLCRMLIIRPYDEVIRPCILYTHGTQGNLQSWVTHYFLGIPDFLQRGYAVAVYENWNSLQHISLINAGDPVYKQWESVHFESEDVFGSPDRTLQRAHYMLYQYAYAAAAFLGKYAPYYMIDENQIFAAGHSAGGLASLLLTFADTTMNYQHPIFQNVGDFKSKVYPGMEVYVPTIKGVFSSGAGLPDPDVDSTFTGTFIDSDDRGKVAVMIHGKDDPAADIEYGPGLWADFVDTMKLMGPLSLKPLMEISGIKSYTLVNCSGPHGVHHYPFTFSDRGGRFQNLSPLSYEYVQLSDNRFFTDSTLTQLICYSQQMEMMSRAGAAVFAEVVAERALQLPAAVYTWETSNWSNPMPSAYSPWYYQPAECGIEGAKAEYFVLEQPTVLQANQEAMQLILYPNPAIDRVFVTDHQLLSDDAWFVVHDAAGRMVRSGFSKEIIEGIDVSSLKKGWYVLLIGIGKIQVPFFGRFVKIGG